MSDALSEDPAQDVYDQIGYANPKVGFLVVNPHVVHLPYRERADIVDCQGLSYHDPIFLSTVFSGCGLFHFMISTPSRAADNPNAKLSTTLESAVNACPFSSNVNVSMLNEENVVKPPKNPAANISRAGSEKLLPSKNVTSTPIRKLPITFTVKVPIGNGIIDFVKDCQKIALNG